MKRIVLSFIQIVVLFVAGVSAFAQGTAFTYQGRLTESGNAFSGNAEFQPTLWNAASGGGQVAANTQATVIVGVTNGLFALPLDFGANFPGAERWLQVEVRTTIGPFTLLVPRQRLTPTPYAITAGNLSGTLPALQLSGTLPGSILSGTYGNALTLNNAANQFSGVFSGNGAGLSEVNALTLGSLGISGFWQTAGNSGTTPGTHFLGTTDTSALEIKVNGLRALRIEYATNSSYGYIPNIVAGSPANIVSNGFVGAVIGGGGDSTFPNRVGNSFATVVGGYNNLANGGVSTAMGFDTVASGGVSTAMGWSTTASGTGSTAMGRSTTANGDYSTAMGYNTTALGYCSTAMGYRAKANHNGTFVWADSQEADFASTAFSQFSIRAGGGVRLSDSTPSISFGTTTRQMLDLWGTGFGIGVQTATLYARSGTRFSWFKNGVHSELENNPGSGGLLLMSLTSAGLEVNGTFVSASDRESKEQFEPLNPREVLDKVVALPLSKWSYKQDPATRHLGPMAQDFYAAFGVGPDDKHIATVDADGVALAAIQGLNQIVKEKDREIQELKRRLVKLEMILNRQ